MTDRPSPLPRHAFVHHTALTTRWLDNDVYGHLNNVVHYSLFDTAVNRYLIDAGALDIHDGDVVGFVAHTQCHYFAPLAFPQEIVAGVRVARVGRSSVTYEIALFGDDAPECAALGRFTHVYVDRATRRPVALPPPLRAAVDALAVAAAA